MRGDRHWFGDHVLFVFPHKFNAFCQILAIQKVGLDIVAIGKRDRIEMQDLKVGLEVDQVGVVGGGSKGWVRRWFKRVG